MSNIALAFAKLDYKSGAAEELFGAIAGEHERIARDGSTQDLSNICWAFAKLGIKADELFEAVSGEHWRIAGEGNEQAMSNISWAFAKNDCKADKLSEAVAGEHKVIARDVTTQALSNITWEFAKLGYSNRRIARDGSPQAWR